MEGQSQQPPEQAPAVAPPDAGFTPYTYGSEEPSSAAPPEPQAPQVPSDWDARLAAAEERAKAAETQNRQFQQGFAELQRAAEAAQAQQEKARLQQESHSRVEQAYRMAADMDPESALQFVRRAEETEKANLIRQIDEVEERANARTFQVVSQIAAPQYARERGKELGLPDEYVDRLAGVPAELIDALLPFVTAIAEERKTFNEKLEQLGRSTDAAAMVASGAYNPSGNGATPVRPGDERLDPTSPNYDKRAFLANILERSGLLKPR